jgi:hypothetical protein
VRRDLRISWFVGSGRVRSGPHPATGAAGDAVAAGPCPKAEGEDREQKVAENPELPRKLTPKEQEERHRAFMERLMWTPGQITVTPPAEKAPEQLETAEGVVMDHPWLNEDGSWFVASELVRRHPEMRIVQVHPSGGRSDRLWVGDWASDDVSDFSATWSLNRWEAGAIHIADGELFSSTPWQDFARTRHPLELVADLERAVGMPAVEAAQPTTRRSLTYRLISHIVTSTVRTRHPVTCRSLYVDTSGYGGGLDVPQHFERHVPSDLLDADGGVTRKAYRFWALSRDDHEIALLADDARGWTGSAEVNLMAVYRTERRLAAVVRALFGRDLV